MAREAFMTSAPIRPDVVQRVLQRRGKLNTIERLDPRRTALIVVDMQNFFMEPGAPVEVPEARAIVPAINRLATATRDSGGTVAWILMTHDETDMKTWSVFYDRFGDKRADHLEGLRAGTHLHALWPEFTTAPQDLTVHKRRFSAFLPESSDLAKILRERGIDTVIITGTLTNVCCMTSALDAMMMNFRMLMVSDANATSVEDHHIAVLNNIFETFGDVRPSDEVIELLRAGAAPARAAE
jgi:ureidoacrylate peracid hydrolase